jgi:hypothetical protein
MAYDYKLWLKRAKLYRITPGWAALATFILAPLGYWFNGDGYKGLRRTVVIFFVGYVTLGLGTFIGSFILPIEVYRVSKRHEKQFTKEKIKPKYYGHAWVLKLLLIATLLLFAIPAFVLFIIIRTQ